MEYRYRDIRPTGACATLIAQYYQQLGLTPDSDGQGAGPVAGGIGDVGALQGQHPGHLILGLQGHDVDPLGISQRLLAACQVPSALCYDGKIDKLSACKMLDTFHIQMFPYRQLQPDMRETDYVICVDAQKQSGNITDFVGDEVACIDHHPTFVPMEYRYRDIRSGSGKLWVWI